MKSERVVVVKPEPGVVRPVKSEGGFVSPAKSGRKVEDVIPVKLEQDAFSPVKSERGARHQGTLPTPSKADSSKRKGAGSPAKVIKDEYQDVPLGAHEGTDTPSRSKSNKLMQRTPLYVFLSSSSLRLFLTESPLMI